MKIHCKRTRNQARPQTEFISPSPGQTQSRRVLAPYHSYDFFKSASTKEGALSVISRIFLYTKKISRVLSNGKCSDMLCFFL
jgi:hypothetical protein